MININSKLILFNSFCIAFRIGIILLLYFLPYQELSILPFIISFGFLYQYFKNKTSFFGSKVYWSRLFHAFTYLTAAILLLIENTKDYAFWVLVGDLIIGFFIVWYHYRNKINSKILKS